MSGNLTSDELLRGWIEYECADHGFLAAGPAGATVTCACGKRAGRFRCGTKLRNRDIKALQIAGSVSPGTPLAA